MGRVRRQPEENPIEEGGGKSRGWKFARVHVGFVEIGFVGLPPRQKMEGEEGVVDWGGGGHMYRDLI